MKSRGGEKRKESDRDLTISKYIISAGRGCNNMY
jgi:hypothetical protein